MLSMNISPGSRLCACLLLAVALGACSRQEQPAATPAPAAATGDAPATTTPAAASPQAPAVAATVQAMSADQLREQTGEDNLEDAFVKVIGSEEGLQA